MEIWQFLSILKWGVADSGDLENDLPELFVRVGDAAKAAGKAWTLLIDEIQYLSE